MKNYDVSYMQKFRAVSAGLSSVLLVCLMLLALPVGASIDSYGPWCDGVSPACPNGAWVSYGHCACQQGFPMMLENNSTHFSSHTKLCNDSGCCTACSASYDMWSGVTISRDKLKLQILIPLYIYPDLGTDDSRWKAIIEAQSKVDITAIINPHNGPLSNTLDPRYRDYQKALQALNNAEVKIMGYVPTNYAKRDQHKIQEDINTYIQYYSIDGIFFDEAANTTQHKDFYSQLTTYIRTKTKLKSVVLNPGTTTAPVYIDTQRSIADTVITFEQAYNHWVSAADPPAWVYTLETSRFALLVHTAPDINAMKRAIDLGSTRHYGYVYVTNDMGDNPWDTLPSYWQDMVTYIQQLNATRFAQHAGPMWCKK